MKQTVLSAQIWALQDKALCDWLSPAKTTCCHRFLKRSALLTLFSPLSFFPHCCYLFDHSMSCLVYKTSENVENVDHCAPNLPVNGLAVATLTFTETVYWVNGELFADNYSKPTIIKVRQKTSNSKHLLDLIDQNRCLPQPKWTVWDFGDGFCQCLSFYTVSY